MMLQSHVWLRVRRKFGAAVCLLGAVLCLLATALPAQAAIDSYEFSSEENARRYHALVEELRCPVCLSSNLSGSDSPISADLRQQVFRLVEDGKSNAEIRDYMHSRYGDFILYRPRLTPFTFLLYATPVLLVGGGLFVIVRLLRGRKRAAQANATGDAQQVARIEQLLAAHGADAPSTHSAATVPAPRNANAS